VATIAVPQTKPWRLGAKTRKAVLVLHIASAGTWIGIDVVMGVVIFTALLTDNQDTKALAYRALQLFAIWPLLATGLVCLATGLLLGLGSKYGLVKYWWVTVKLTLNLILTGLVLVALKPTVDLAAKHGQAHVQTGASVPNLLDLVFPPIVSPTALLIAFVLSVYKPWGRIRKNGQR
jgi:hypothetical protein